MKTATTLKGLSRIVKVDWEKGNHEHEVLPTRTAVEVVDKSRFPWIVRVSDAHYLVRDFNSLSFN